MTSSSFWASTWLGIVSELGDESFFLVVILAAWCPVNGARNGRAHLQQCLVAVGAVAAISMRAALSWWGLRLETMDWVLGPAATALLVALALKAYVELQQRDFHERRQHIGRRPVAVASSASPPMKNISLGGGGFLGNFKAYDPESYADDVQAPPSLSALPLGIASGLCSGLPRLPGASGQADFHQTEVESGNGNAETVGANAPWAALHQQHMKHGQGYGSMTLNQQAGSLIEGLERKVDNITAFLVPLLMLLVAEANDKSQWAMVSVRGENFHSAFGVVFGCALCIMIAVVAGHILERQLTESRLLLIIVGGLASLSLVSLSMTFLEIHGVMPVLSPLTVPTSTLSAVTMATPKIATAQTPPALALTHFVKNNTHIPAVALAHAAGQITANITAITHHHIATEGIPKDSSKLGPLTKRAVEKATIERGPTSLGSPLQKTLATSASVQSLSSAPATRANSTLHAAAVQKAPHSIMAALLRGIPATAPHSKLVTGAA